MKSRFGPRSNQLRTALLSARYLTRSFDPLVESFATESLFFRLVGIAYPFFVGRIGRFLKVVKRALGGKEQKDRQVLIRKCARHDSNVRPLAS